MTSILPRDPYAPRPVPSPYSGGLLGMHADRPSAAALRVDLAAVVTGRRPEQRGDDLLPVRGAETRAGVPAEAGRVPIVVAGRDVPQRPGGRVERGVGRPDGPAGSL